MTAGPLIPAGYFPKRTAVPAGWTAAGCVSEICSVSGCIASPPEGWIELWLHHDLGFFNTRADAGKAVHSDTQDFSLFAYRLLPARFGVAGQEPFSLELPSVEPIGADFLSLGFDAVSRSVSAYFECSPLSCNGMAGEIAVNQYCLLATLEEAIAVAARFASEELEPGPYYVLEVLRASTSGW